MLKRIAAAQLRPGMFIQEFCGSWMDHPFWSKSLALQSDKDLRKILDSPITEVWIDTARGLDVAQPAPHPAKATAPAVEAALGDPDETHKMAYLQGPLA